MNRMRACLRAFRVLPMFAGTGMLLLLCFGLLMIGSPPVRANGNTLRVPADFPTIQAAINAAPSGATILVMGKNENNAPQAYDENLVITKSLTLEGDLDANYAPAEGVKAEINGNEAGRAVTIQANSPGVTVTMLGFQITNGNATGLGGAEPISAPETIVAIPSIQTLGSFGRVSLTPEARTAAQQIDIAAAVAGAKTQLAQLLAQGALPEGAGAYASVPAELDRLAVELLATQERALVAGSAPSPVQRHAAAAEVDCGGGLYDHGAALTLDRIIFSGNVASRTDTGYGGGLCVATAPSEGIQLTDVSFGRNIGSQAGEGAGGGAFIAETAGATLQGAVFVSNFASQKASGQGGGLMLYHAAHTELEGTQFISNQGSTGASGMGGGLMVESSPSVTVTRATVANNIASSGVFGSAGTGGGIQALRSDNLSISGDSSFGANVAGANGFGQGGAVAIAALTGAHISASSFNLNVAAQGRAEVAIGGAIQAYNVSGLMLTDNHFTANMSSGNPATMGYGGAAAILDCIDVEIAQNVLSQNMATAIGAGVGGGLFISKGQSTNIHDNQFVSNRAAMLALDGSVGGGAAIGNSTGTVFATNIVTANVGAFLNADPARPTPGDGGGLASSAVNDFVVRGNQFENNVATTAGIETTGPSSVSGGALSVLHGRGPNDEAIPSENVTISSNNFVGNFALVDGQGLELGYGKGGAIRLAAIKVIVDHNVFRNNATCAINCDAGMRGSFGGGLSVFGTDSMSYGKLAAEIVVAANQFEGNSALLGSAVSFESTAAVTMTNNVIAPQPPSVSAVFLEVANPYGDNRGASVVNNTFYGTGATALEIGEANDSVAQIINNIIVSHTVGVDVVIPGTLVNLDYNLFNVNGKDVRGTGLITNSHPITGLVRFLNVAQNNFRLMPNSAAIDAGDPAGVPPAPAVDIDNRPRPYGPRVDVGAYEWQGQGSFLPDVRKD